MKRRHKIIQIGTLALLILGLIFHFTGGSTAATGVPAVFATMIVIMICSFIAASTKELPPPPRKRTTEISLPGILQKEASEEIDPSETMLVLGKAHRKQTWAETEERADVILDTCIAVIRTQLRAYTVSVFFPTNDGGYMLRRYKSACDFINNEAVLYCGVGVIGSFLKDGLTRINLKEIINDSATLYYYTQDAGIRSLIASPIFAADCERGIVIADSTVPNNFTDEDLLFLENIAALLGQTIYSSYLCTEHKLQHERLAAMSTIEKEFFQDLSRTSILDKITQLVPFALPCTRLTISLKNENGISATLVAAVGKDAEAFINTTFPLDRKSLASIVYTNNMALARNFSKEHYELRYFPEELRDDTLQSFVAIPLGVDRCLGMLLVESSRKNAFDESNRELLSRLSTSAGLAIEKLLIFEKANTLATRDGLTGLYNHRTFQQVLTDEITRAIRFSEPVSLVICDIDHFKKINDTYGHPFGDVVLKGVAATLQNSIRQDIDTVARYGGEEFSIILVKTDTAGALEMAERIRTAIASVSYKGPGGNDVNVTMSFGIAEFKKDARQINELVAKADKALYRAKENGRNRVEAF